MSPHFVLLLFLTNRFHINAFEKSFTLNPNQLGGSDIDLILTDNHVTTNNNAWHINPSTQNSTDLKLLLHPQWGFHPSVQSNINIIIDGFTPNVTKEDGEMLMLFAVDNIQYFSMFISLEQGQAWKSYPSWQYQSLATSNDIVSNIIAVNDPARYYRTCNSNSPDIDNWVPIGSPWYKTALQWPLNIQITNDPINNKLYYNCYLSDKTLSVTYQTSFLTNKGMTVYIMKDASDGKPFDIYSIHVSYTYATLPPTNTPTNTPTNMPTHNPSAFPTSFPTKLPTYMPSNNPTISPTNNPTLIPTNNPSVSPTNNPTFNPSVIPSISPTTPTISPSNIPTLSPSKYPTISPSLNPEQDEFVSGVYAAGDPNKYFAEDGDSDRINKQQNVDIMVSSMRTRSDNIRIFALFVVVFVLCSGGIYHFGKQKKGQKLLGDECEGKNGKYTALGGISEHRSYSTF